MQHLIIGAGEVGQAIAHIIRLSGMQVYVRDVDSNNEPDKVDVLHICYGWSEGFVNTVLRYASQYCPQYLIIHSTVVPGTTEDIAWQVSCQVAYSPVRGRHDGDGQMIYDLYRKYIKFVAGDEEAGECLREAGFRIAWFNNVASLELAKLLETSYTGLLIVWAQEMRRFAVTCDADLDEVHRFFFEVEHLPRYQFIPGYIGGHCIMQNLELLEKVRKSWFVDAIRWSNELRYSEAGVNVNTRYRPKLLSG